MMLPEKLRFHVLYSKHVSVSCFYLETVLPIGSGKQIRFSFAFLYLCSLFPQMKNAGKPWHCCVVRLWLQAQRGPGPVAAGAAWRCSAIMSRLAGSGTTGNWSSKIFPSSLHAIYMFIMEVFKALMTRNAHCGERMIEAEPGDCRQRGRDVNHIKGSRRAAQLLFATRGWVLSLSPDPGTDVLTHPLQTSVRRGKAKGKNPKQTKIAFQLQPATGAS